jgi:hypothetical protein
MVFDRPPLARRGKRDAGGKRLHRALEIDVGGGDVMALTPEMVQHSVRTT